jgi:hypothetical protein
MARCGSFQSGLRNNDMNIATLLSLFDQINFNLIVGEWKTWKYMINQIGKYTLYLQAIV